MFDITCLYIIIYIAGHYWISMMKCVLVCSFGLDKLMSEHNKTHACAINDVFCIVEDNNVCLYVDCNPINFRIMLYCRNSFNFFFSFAITFSFRRRRTRRETFTWIYRGYTLYTLYSIRIFIIIIPSAENKSFDTTINRMKKKKEKEIIALTYYLFVIYLYLWLSRDDIFNYRNVFIYFICKHLSLLLVSVRVPVPPGRPWIPLSRPNKNIPSCELVTCLYNIIMTIIVFILLLLVLRFTVKRSIYHLQVQ